jgi:Domain of unknown function (DUF4386)
VAVQLTSGTHSAVGYDVSSIVFSFYNVTIGYLVFRSTFLPRWIGVLLVLGGLSCLTYGFTDIVAPAAAPTLCHGSSCPHWRASSRSRLRSRSLG